MSSPPAYETVVVFMDLNSAFEDGTIAFIDLYSILEDGTPFIDLNSILEDGTTFIDLSLLPVYRIDASYRTTDQIYSWIRGDLPPDTVLPSPTYQLLQQAKASMKLLWSTKALCKAFCLRLYNNWFGLTECTRATGLAILPFIVIGDIFVNIPVQFIRATRTIGEDAFEIWRTKQKAKIHIIDQIQDSLAIRLEATLKVIRDLGLETPSILDRKTQGDEILDILLSHGDNEDRVILYIVTLSVTALASRFSPEGTICLASGNILPRIYCPPLFLELFDLIYCLKVNPILTNITLQHLGTVPTLEYCLRKLVPALKAGATKANDMPPQLHQLLPTLRDMNLEISCKSTLVERFKDII
jgi:hypothetical protein